MDNVPYPPVPRTSALYIVFSEGSISGVKSRMLLLRHEVLYFVHSTPELRDNTVSEAFTSCLEKHAAKMLLKKAAIKLKIIEEIKIMNTETTPIIKATEEELGESDESEESDRKTYALPLSSPP